MDTRRVGQVVSSLVLISTVIAVYGFQWNDTHLFNAEWHPHARFHLVQLIGFTTAMSAIALWLLWRPSPGPRIAATVTTIAAIMFWGGEFYALAVPGTSPAYDLDHPNIVELPVGTVYGNLLFAGLMITLTAVAYALIRTGTSRTPGLATATSDD